MRIKSDNLELTSLEIATKHAKSFLFVSWYRPPTADDAAFEDLREVLKNSVNDSKEIIFVGDRNCYLKNNKTQAQKNNSNLLGVPA